jgi:hypothetical protein
MTADSSPCGTSHLLLLLFVLALYVLPHCIQIIPILLPAAWAGVVVLTLQPLVAEQAHLIPADMQQKQHWQGYSRPRVGVEHGKLEVQRQLDSQASPGEAVLCVDSRLSTTASRLPAGAWEEVPVRVIKRLDAKGALYGCFLRQNTTTEQASEHSWPCKQAERALTTSTHSKE